MPNRINVMQIREYKEHYQEAASIIAVGYEGLGVETTNLFRQQLDERCIRLAFVRNRIIDLAFKDLGRPQVRAICKGQTAFAQAEDVVSMARFLVDFGKEHKALKIHGGLVEEQILDTKEVLALAKSPTRVELHAIISGQALKPGASISSALLGPAQTIAGQVESMIEKMDEKESA